MIKPGELIGDLGILPLIEGLTAGLKGTDYNLMGLPQVNALNEAFSDVQEQLIVAITQFRS